MNYLVFYGNEVIGTILSPGADPPMGMVHGPFRPTPAYQKVQAVFRLFGEATWANPNQDDDAEKLARYYREREALPLSVTTAEGLPVPVSWVHIDDFAEVLDEDEGYKAEFNVPPIRSSNPLACSSTTPAIGTASTTGPNTTAVMDLTPRSTLAIVALRRFWQYDQRVSP